jgi:flagellar assembly protein FliH
MIKSSKTIVDKVIHPQPEEEAKKWEIPTVTPPEDLINQEKTNALGFKSTWKYEPPDQHEEVEPKPLTAEEIEEIRQAAYSEGFNQGKEEGFTKGFEEGKVSGFEEGKSAGHQVGYDEGLAQGQEEIEQLTKQWQQLIEHLHQPLDIVDKNIEQQLFELTAQLTEAIVRHEAKINPDILMSAISEAIKALPAQEAQTQIYLHPEDIKRVESAFGAQHIQESGWRLLPAPQLEVGGCQVENSTSNIDMRIKSRIKEVLEPFLQNALHQ